MEPDPGPKVKSSLAPWAKFTAGTLGKHTRTLAPFTGQPGATARLPSAEDTPTWHFLLASLCLFFACLYFSQKPWDVIIFMGEESMA